MSLHDNMTEIKETNSKPLLTSLQRKHGQPLCRKVSPVQSRRIRTGSTDNIPSKSSKNPITVKGTQQDKRDQAEQDHEREREEGAPGQARTGAVARLSILCGLFVGSGNKHESEDEDQHRERNPAGDNAAKDLCDESDVRHLPVLHHQRDEAGQADGDGNGVDQQPACRHARELVDCLPDPALTSDLCISRSSRAEWDVFLSGPGFRIRSVASSDQFVVVGDLCSVQPADADHEREQGLPDGEQDELPALATADHGEDREHDGDDELDAGQGYVEAARLEVAPWLERGLDQVQTQHGVVGEQVRGEADGAVGETVALDLGLDGAAHCWEGILEPVRELERGGLDLLRKRAQGEAQDEDADHECEVAQHGVYVI
jgi:hypothetical protein